LLFAGIVPAGDIDLLRRVGVSPFAPLDSTGKAALFFYHAARVRRFRGKPLSKKRTVYANPAREPRALPGNDVACVWLRTDAWEKAEI
jgi:hypothetical protein